MYSQLHAPMIQTQQEEIATRASRRHELQSADSTATARTSKVRRGAGKAIAVLGVCAAITGVAVSDASARQSGMMRRTQVSARQLVREIRALESVGFVPTSCEVRGTLMTNPGTGQSLILPS